jgi:hypothetical protein
MKITTKITISIATGEVMEHEFYEYSGPVALACGATSGQQQLATQQTSGYTTLVNQAQSQFGNASGVFQDLVSSFAPIVAAGPNQEGFAPAELSALNSAAITSAGQGYRNAKAAVGNAESAFGGGNTGDTSGGATVGENLSLAENAANQTSSELTNIKEADYNQGRENYFNAASGLAGAPGVFGTANQAGSVATGAGEAAEKSQNDVASQDNSWVGAVTGALGNVAGMATGGFMKNLGSGSTSGKSSTPSQ